MPHVVSPRCMNNRNTACCSVCPVGAFFEVKEPAMLVIHPDICIDCAICVSECPTHAIYSGEELPDCYAEWADKNAELAERGERVTEKKSPLPGARPLQEIQDGEGIAGLSVDEPSKAGR